MDTKYAAKILGVSTSTVQRWVKHFALPLDRNELGHYIFTEESIEVLRQIKTQIQQGVLLADLKLPNNLIQKQSANPVNAIHQMEHLQNQITQLENNLNQKADSVVSYQLLLHRQEIEELHEQVKMLSKKIAELELKQKLTKKSHLIDPPLPYDQTSVRKKNKKRNIIGMLFGF
ncbi:MerR family transcriptional regulator [Peribacillus saganii]|uniref:Chromosome-anchoring protein RacA n=1 Tax=Peribacillus saganii TaxID=2303992 RepID=A0A372LQJ1_9BACI|nr:MerR family transcriptional regulator [Peribacillus saganii]RFU70471.1 MerR family transcriptional regulator [Peribacillus saganii]